MDRMPTPVKHRNDEENIKITAPAIPPGSEKSSRKSQLFENSLKPLLTPDKWTNFPICLENLHDMTKICSNMQKNIQENIHNMEENMNRNAEYEEAISLHILHILYMSICRICRI